MDHNGTESDEDENELAFDMWEGQFQFSGPSGFDSDIDIDRHYFTRIKDDENSVGMEFSPSKPWLSGELVVSGAAAASRRPAGLSQSKGRAIHAR